jgi:hypothetical protein
MIEFEWFDWSQLRIFDQQLLDCTWINPEIRSRVMMSTIPYLEGHHRNRMMDHDQFSPWASRPSRWPVPRFDDRLSDRAFSDCFDQVMDQLVQSHQDKKIYVFWSGGIDSTTVICALIKHIPVHQYKKIKILASSHSIIENRVFYHKMILPNFEMLDIDNCDLSAIFQDNDAVFLDGEGGNQINLGFHVYNKANAGDWQWLDQNWKDVDIIQMLGWQPSTQCKQVVDAWTKSIAQSPVPIRNLYEFFWWVNFIFKLEQTMYRKPVRTYSSYINVPFHDFIDKKMIRPYAHEIMQQWSMCSVESRQWHDKRIAIKYFQRKYIYDVDHNEFYFRYKKERGSGSILIDSIDSFALDTQGNIYSFSNKEHRHKLRTWLETGSIC